MNKLIGLGIVVLIAAAGIQMAGHTTKVSAFGTEVHGFLDAVSLDDPEAIIPDIVEAAEKEGLEVNPRDVSVTVEDTDKQEAVSGLLARKGIAQSKQVRVTIEVAHSDALLGVFPLKGNIRETDIRTIQVRARRVGEEMYQQMEAEEEAARQSRRDNPVGAANMMRQKARDLSTR